jgi:cytochrome c peroxidase
MPDLAGLPVDASPGGTPGERDAWNRLPVNSQYAVTRIFSNIGKAIAAYERTLAYQESRFDRYVEGLLQRDAPSTATLTPQEVNGLRLFIGKGQCATCYSGPLLTDQHFHNTGVPQRIRNAPTSGVPRVWKKCSATSSTAWDVTATRNRRAVTGCGSSSTTIGRWTERSRRPACATWRYVCRRGACKKSQRCRAGAASLV